MAWGEATGYFDSSWSWESYMSIRFVGGVTITVSDDKTNMHVHMFDLSVTYSPGSTTGAGFLNVGSIGRYEDNYKEFSITSDYSDETYELAISQLNETFPDYLALTVWGVALSDDASHKINHTFSNYDDWDVALTDDDFNADGTMKDKTILNCASRWYKGSATASCGIAGYFSLSTEQLDWDYFPWAIYKDGTWKSCNRAGGSLQRREGGVWIDRKNNQGNDGNTVFYRDSGSWVKAPEIGES